MLNSLIVVLWLSVGYDDILVSLLLFCFFFGCEREFRRLVIWLRLSLDCGVVVVGVVNDLVVFLDL